MAYIDGELRTPLYRDSTWLLKVEQYAMQRYYASWHRRNLRAAERFYFAAERCKLLLRANARAVARSMQAYDYNGRSA